MSRMIGFGVRLEPKEPDNPFVADRIMPATWHGTWVQTALRCVEMLVGIGLALLVLLLTYH